MEDIEDAFQHALEESQHLNDVKKHLYQARKVVETLALAIDKAPSSYCVFPCAGK